MELNSFTILLLLIGISFLFLLLRYLYFILGYKDSNYPNVQQINRKLPKEETLDVLPGSRAGEGSLLEKLREQNPIKLEVEILADNDNELDSRFSRDRVRDAFLLEDLLHPKFKNRPSVEDTLHPPISTEKEEPDTDQEDKS